MAQLAGLQGTTAPRLSAAYMSDASAIRNVLGDTDHLNVRDAVRAVSDEPMEESIRKGAKNLAEIVELQSGFIRQQFDTLTSQAGEVRALSTKIAADTAEPIKEQVTRSFDKTRTS